MNKSQARGYLLEIVLSKLIEINGYESIRTADNYEIVSEHHGLNVKGRGGLHQFDTLGRFRITPPFVYPLRLFVEAKFQSNPVGIDRVRMGIGILDDVNSNYSTVQMGHQQLTVERYQYHYAIFSASGFTDNALRLAIAHKIQLIDLSGDEYRVILDFINEIVECLSDIYSQENSTISKEDFAEFKEQFSKIIREESDESDFIYSREILDAVKDLKCVINGMNLYFATVNNQFIIPLLSDKKFKNSLSMNPHKYIAIKRKEDHPNKWIITSKDNQDFLIRFTLPNVLHEYMISNINHKDNIAMDIKENRIGRLVFIAYLDGYNPTLCTLKFDKDFTQTKLE